MNAVLIVTALVTLGTAAVAMTLRNLIHSALLLIASWAGVAAFYLWAGAEFVAFAEILVYVGAVSMVVLFAVLLTRRSRADLTVTPDSAGRAISGFIAAGAVCGVLVGAIVATPIGVASSPTPTVTVKQIGAQLMGTHATSLLIVGVLLTVALLGAIVIASADRKDDSEDTP
jgi:NADH:ubiquinone oxidoreductase subunit 6 (subunit J)